MARPQKDKSGPFTSVVQLRSRAASIWAQSRRLHREEDAILTSSQECVRKSRALLDRPFLGAHGKRDETS